MRHEDECPFLWAIILEKYIGKIPIRYGFCDNNGPIELITARHYRFVDGEITKVK